MNVMQIGQPQVIRAAAPAITVYGPRLTGRVLTRPMRRG
jgi:hypothetical protein